MQVSAFNAMYGLSTCICVYECACMFLSMTGTGIVSIWYNVSGCCVYGCMETGNFIIRFLSLSIPQVTNFIS